MVRTKRSSKSCWSCRGPFPSYLARSPSCVLSLVLPSVPSPSLFLRLALVPRSLPVPRHVPSQLEPCCVRLESAWLLCVPPCARLGEWAFAQRVLYDRPESCRRTAAARCDVGSGGTWRRIELRGPGGTGIPWLTAAHGIGYSALQTIAAEHTGTVRGAVMHQLEK